MNDKIKTIYCLLYSDNFNFITQTKKHGICVAYVEELIKEKEVENGVSISEIGKKTR